MGIRTVAALLLAGLSGGLSAQMADPLSTFHRSTHVVAGRVVSSNGPPVGELRIELSPTPDHGPGVSGHSSGDGSFRLAGIAPGNYRLRLFDRAGREVHSEIVAIVGSNSFLTVCLTAPAGERPVTGTVSLARLQHKVPKKAKKEYLRAAKARRRGDLDAAFDHLRKALDVDEYYYEARLSLGVLLLKSGHAEESLEHVSVAMRMDPSASEAHAVAALALSALNRYRGAEITARIALRQDRTSAVAHYALGLALVGQNKSPQTAIESLRYAAPTVPEARLAAARALEVAGDLAGARAELQRYLESGAVARRELAAAWLERLSSPAVDVAANARPQAE